jgi:hypothetical protein
MPSRHHCCKNQVRKKKMNSTCNAMSLSIDWGPTPTSAIATFGVMVGKEAEGE